MEDSIRVITPARTSDSTRQIRKDFQALSLVSILFQENDSRVPSHMVTSPDTKTVKKVTLTVISQSRREGFPAQSHAAEVGNKNLI